MEDCTAPWRVLFALFAAVFAATLGVGVFIFAIPLLALQHAVPGLLWGAGFSGYFCAKLFASPVAGKLSDSIGPKPLLSGAAFLGLFAAGLCVFSQRQSVLYAVQFFLGLTVGTMKPVTVAALAALTPEEARGRIFGLSSFVFTGAFFLAPALGGFLFYHGDLHPICLFLVACMGTSLCLVLCIPSKMLTTTVKKQKLEIPSPALRAGLSFSLFMAIAGRTLCTACLITFYPALLSENLQAPTWMIGLLVALPSAAACVLVPFGGWLADRGQRGLLVAGGMSLSAFCLVFLGWTESLGGFVCVGALLGVGSGLSFPASMSMAASLGRAQGRIMGWFHGVGNAGFVLGPLVCGLLVERYAELSLPLEIMGTVGLATVLPLVFQLRTVGSFAVRLVWSLVLCSLIFFVVGQNPQGQQQVYAAFQEEGQHFAGLAMGNVLRMTLYGINEEQARQCSQQAFAAIADLEQELSHRNGGGSVGRVNLAAGKTPENVGPVAFALIERALNICQKSGGIFDISIGAITTLPYYYRERAEQEKKELVDYRKISIDPQEQTVFLPQNGMALDLGGLAKGTVLDGAAASLRKNGVPCALVEAGGDLFCYGDRIWQVGIQDPRGDGLLGVIQVSNAGVCGSGDYYQYTEIVEKGVTKRLHHILDPELLDSAQKSIAVTVIAPSAELADALATTLFIMGPDAGQVFLQQYPDCAALWVLPDKTMLPSTTFPRIQPS